MLRRLFSFLSVVPLFGGWVFYLTSFIKPYSLILDHRKYKKLEIRHQEGEIYVTNKPQHDLEEERNSRAFREYAAIELEMSRRSLPDGRTLSMTPADRDKEFARRDQIDNERKRLQLKFEADYPIPQKLWSRSLSSLYVAGGASVPIVLLSAWRFRRWARRSSGGHCPSCGYDLRASPERCPECGAAAMLGPPPV